MKLIAGAQENAGHCVVHPAPSCAQTPKRSIRAPLALQERDMQECTTVALFKLVFTYRDVSDNALSNMDIHGILKVYTFSSRLL